MADYFKHWLNMGKRMAKPPKIFHVNWFRADAKGKFLWPGFKENLRVLEWILDRCNARVGALKTPIGYVPHQEDIDMTGLELAQGAFEKLLEVHKEGWVEELRGIKKFFSQFKRDLPPELWQEYTALQGRLKSNE
jgi:phosphoenolpyruvate carboxykinase (GTP)